jgi:hypothetical protein
MDISSVLMMLQVALVWVAHAVNATTFPATVEIDLIFPRNDTYAPTALFPIVFAFQNAALATSLDPGIEIILYNGTRPNLTTVASRVLDLRYANFSGSDPTYVYTYITGLETLSGGAAASFNLNWETSAGNCSKQGGILTFGGGWVDTSMHFTIQNGAQQPDLVAATTPSGAACSNASHFAFNLTNTLDVTQPEKWDGHKTCAVFSVVQRQVPGNPCAVEVSSSTASSILAAMTSRACTAVNPIVSCPSSNKSAAAESVRMGYDTAFLGWVIMAAFVTIQCL